MRTRDVERFKHANFMKKASEFHDEMLSAYGAGRWNAVGLNGIHCVISCCDALTVYYLGKRHAGDRHEGVVSLLQQIPDIEGKEKKQRVNQVLDVLRPKARVEYHAEVFSKKDADVLVKQAGRIYAWAGGLLG